MSLCRPFRLGIPPFLELSAAEGLPDGAESTADIPPKQVKLLKAAFDGLPAPFAALVAGRRVCPRRTTEDYMVQPQWVPFPSTLSYRRHETGEAETEAIATAFRPNASGVADLDHLLQLHRPSCRLVVHRRCSEAEPRLFPLRSPDGPLRQAGRPRWPPSSGPATSWMPGGIIACCMHSSTNHAHVAIQQVCCSLPRAPRAARCRCPATARYFMSYMGTWLLLHAYGTMDVVAGRWNSFFTADTASRLGKPRWNLRLTVGVNRIARKHL
uniref:Uncharacterized protein n=1 Tax=Panicum miliaceum TaxID=4540 RepID=A0A3L6RU35_PANMI|nr:hypothetical protein C2845_PM11G23960 [Panicum miliaceum]